MGEIYQLADTRFYLVLFGSRVKGKPRGIVKSVVESRKYYQWQGESVA